jgi:hypothetical protein
VFVALCQVAEFFTKGCDPNVAQEGVFDQFLVARDGGASDGMDDGAGETFNIQVEIVCDVRLGMR